jgi:hypothetical protein
MVEWLKVKALSSSPSTAKKKRVENTLEHLGINNNFLNRTQMTQQLKERMDKQDYMKQKQFCTAKEMVTRLKR